MDENDPAWFGCAHHRSKLRRYGRGIGFRTRFSPVSGYLPVKQYPEVWHYRAVINERLGVSSAIADEIKPVQLSTETALDMTRDGLGCYGGS